MSLSRDSATLMVGQYFKRRREMVEIVLVSSHGVGILVISQLLHNSLRTFGWRLGLQALTVLITATFFLGMFYRYKSLASHSSQLWNYLYFVVRIFRSTDLPHCTTLREEQSCT